MQSSVITALVGMAAMITGLSVQPAFASPDLNCGAYATAAIEQQNQNVALGCGFSGNAWHTDFQRHFGWCARPDVRMENLTTEDYARKDALAKCSARQASCQAYAQQAVSAQQFNVQNNCGFSGGAWHTDYQRHYGWCITVDEARANQETLVRTMHTQQCK